MSLVVTFVLRLRRVLRPLHPRRVLSRLRHLAHRLGWLHVRLWASGLSPRRLAGSWRWLRGQRAVLRSRREEPRLTVAVDISPFWEPLTGIGWYLYRLLEAMASRDDVRLRLYGPSLVDKGDQPPPVVPLPRGPALEEVRWRIPEDFSIVHYWLAERLRKREGWLVDRDQNDVLFAPNYLLPPRLASCTGTRVVTIHDLAVEVVPETMRESTRRELASSLRQSARRADLVLTDSAAVAAEIAATGWVPPERLRSVWLGPGAGTLATPWGGGEPPGDLPARYLLHVGTLEPRKNLDLLLDAWLAIESEHPDAHLLLVGGAGWKSEALRERIAGLGPQRVRALGYCSEEEIAGYYRDASWVVLPSLYEGFGLPAVEALHHGVPLLASDLPVLREVAGPAALYAPPRDVRAWSALLDCALRDRAPGIEGAGEGAGGIREHLSEIARARAADFDWHHTAEATLAAWREAGAG